MPLPQPTIQYEPQQSGPLDQYSKVLSLRSLLQAGQLQQQQLQTGQLENQQRQLALRDQEVVRQAFIKNNGDLDGTLMDAAKNGASPQTLQGLQQHALQVKAQSIDLVNKQGEKAVRDADLIQGAYDTLSKAPSEQRAAMYPQLVNGLKQAQVDTSQLPPQYPGDDHLPVLGAMVQGHAKQIAQAAQQAGISKDTAQAAQAQSAADKNNAELQFYKGQGLAPGVTPEMAGYAAYIRQGGRPEQYKAWQAQQEAKATLPTKIQLAGAEADARQKAAQGDPNVAGQMLASGDLTLADLKSRGTTPQYITQAVTAAKRAKPDYNPADEVIAEQVAKSPAANQFFGSANSLISKGGTLDQLTQLGNNIPQHGFPVLNTVDDWQKLARGNGPLAGYAATALGAADDYGKVMGGGNASDSARNSALALFAKAASPEQRASAIAATRNAVQSQRDSRIGNNQFLKRQYGSEVGGQGAPIVVQTPKGPYTFKDQASADAFKKEAGIQ